MIQYTVVKTFKTFRHSLYHRTPRQVLDIICDDLGDRCQIPSKMVLNGYSVKE